MSASLPTRPLPIIAEGTTCGASGCCKSGDRLPPVGKSREALQEWLTRTEAGEEPQLPARALRSLIAATADMA